MNATRHTFAIVASGLVLAGCQTFGNAPRQFDAGLQIPDQEALRAQAERQLAAGRAALERRNYASAIAALREAALEPEFAASAHNGLGVAYAGIGRNDLAERYFIQASTEDPAEERYRDNLVRLYRARLVEEVARRDRARLAQEQRAIVEAQRNEATLQAGLQAQLPHRRIVRVGPSEVQINSTGIRPEASRIVVQELHPVRVEVPAPEAMAPGQEPRPGDRGPEPRPADVAIEGRRVTINRHIEASSLPAVVTITSTGRRYDGRLSEVPAFADARLRPTRRIAAAPAIGPAVLRPLHLPKPLFGNLDDVEPIGDLDRSAE